MAVPYGEGWAMRPVIRGYCKYESLVDGTLVLEDIARLNDAIDVVDENDKRWRDYYRNG